MSSTDAALQWWDPQKLSDYNCGFASAREGHLSNCQIATRDGAVWDQAHSLSRKQKEPDKPFLMQSVSELCSSEGFTGGPIKNREGEWRCVLCGKQTLLARNARLFRKMTFSKQFFPDWIMWEYKGAMCLPFLKAELLTDSIFALNHNPLRSFQCTRAKSTHL